MIPDLLWIVGFYVAAAVIVHWLLRRRTEVNRRQYVLVAGNHQMQIEWYIRALQQFSLRTGTEIGITVVLNESSDDTGRIMERFARQDAGIEVFRGEPSRLALEESVREHQTPKHAIWVELARKEDLARLPL